MYATVTDLITRFGQSELVQLTDANGTGEVNDTVANGALDDASNVIDGYLDSRYTLPLTAVPKMLAKLCCDMARYNLHGNAVPDVVDKNNTAALRLLAAIGKGDVSLGLSDNSQVPATDDTIVIESGGSVFNRADSKGFI